jgi:Zn ribbon nucleic-acid-binding protein
MQSDVQYARDEPCLIRYTALDGITCPQCESGEVHQPMQTCDLPVYYCCLRCGHHATASAFR